MDDARGGFRVAHRREGDTNVVSVEGELDLSSAPALARALGEVPGGEAVVVDLSCVGFIDSTGLRVLVRERQGRPAGFHVGPASEVVGRLLQLSGLEDLREPDDERAQRPDVLLHDWERPSDDPVPADWGEVDLRVPAEARFLRVARLVVAGIATDLGAPLERLEELRVAVDEMCTALLAGVAPDRQLRLVYRSDGRRLSVRGQCHAEDTELEIDHLAQEVLSVFCDRWEIHANGTTKSFRFELDLDQAG